MDKIIFIADNIEPQRGNSLLQKIQADEITNPDECIKLIINDKIIKAKHKNMELNPMLNYTLESIDER